MKNAGGWTRRAVLLDRDGTLLDETGYLGDPRGVRLYPGAAEAVRDLNRAGYLVLVVTNQSGIARGYYSESDNIATNLAMYNQLRAGGALLNGIYYCRHHPDEGCRCRKPGTFMAERAARDFGVEMGESWLVGDTASDMAMAQAAGMSSVLVMTGKHEKGDVTGVALVAEGLKEAVQIILGEGG